MKLALLAVAMLCQPMCFQFVSVAKHVTTHCANILRWQGRDKTNNYYHSIDSDIVSSDSIVYIL